MSAMIVPVPRAVPAVPPINVFLLISCVVLTVGSCLTSDTTSVKEFTFAAPMVALPSTASNLMIFVVVFSEDTNFMIDSMTLASLPSSHATDTDVFLSDSPSSRLFSSYMVASLNTM